MRVATPYDVPDILAIEVSAFEPGLRWDFADIVFEVSAGRILVYFGEDAQMVGYVAFKLRDSIGMLQSVAVAPASQRTNIGRMLVGAAMDLMWDAGAECIELECNTDLVPFYRRFGFDVCGFYTRGVGVKQIARVRMRRMP